MDDDAHGTPAPYGEAAAWTILAYLISGPLLYGSLGRLADLWLGTYPVLTSIGIVFGVVAGCYLAWVRYGTHDRRPPTASPDAGHHPE